MITNIHFKINQATSIDQTLTFLNSLNPHVRQFSGGRRIKKIDTTGTLSLNQIIKHVDKIITNNQLDPLSAENAQKLIDKIRMIDSDLNIELAKVSKKNIFLEILTKIRQLPNIFYNREKVLTKIQGIIEVSLKTTQINKERPKELSEKYSEAIYPSDTFQKLIENANKCLSFKELPPLPNSAFNNFKREILKGFDEKNQNLIYIKIPFYKHTKAQREALKNDQLAFMISHALNFNVVPPTKVVHFSTLPKISTDEIQGVIQSAVVPDVFQFHLAVNDSLSQDKIDLNHLHKVALFNMIVGRCDGRSCNSVLGLKGRFMEVDNENIGKTTTDFWLLNDKSWFKETILNAELIDAVIALEESFISDVFKAAQERDGFVFSNNEEINILGNLKKIKAFFVENRHHPIRISDLILLNQPKVLVNA